MCCCVTSDVGFSSVYIVPVEELLGASITAVEGVVVVSINLAKLFSFGY